MAHSARCCQCPTLETFTPQVQGNWESTYRPLRNRLNLLPHVLLQLIRTLRIRRRLIVVFPAVIVYQLRIPDEVLRRVILIALQLRLHGAEIHRLGDDVVVIRHLIPVDRVRERPRGAVVLQIVEQVHELVVIGAVARLAGEFVHVWGPTGGLDGGDGHGVDFAGAGFPFFGGGVHDVAFGEGADFGLHGFFLLEEHSADFEIPDARDHGALHDGAAFVVFNIAHPSGFIERDFFREPLLFEVPDGVVVGVGKEMLDGGSGFDVVFKMGHEMRAVAFDLLVRGDSAENDLGEFAGIEWAVRDPPYDL